MIHPRPADDHELGRRVAGCLCLENDTTDREKLAWLSLNAGVASLASTIHEARMNRIAKEAWD